MSIPNRVAFESPFSGDVVSGTVVDHELRASAVSVTTLLTVNVDGTRLRVPRSKTVASDPGNES